MRLEDPNTVDYLGIEEATNCIVVTLVDDCDWTDEVQHLALLQAKLNRYLEFIESGEVLERVADTVGYKATPTTPVKINIMAKYEPLGEGPRFLEYAAAVARDAGVEFQFRVVAWKQADDAQRD